jgi:hypothetical protein
MRVITERRKLMSELELEFVIDNPGETRPVFIGYPDGLGSTPTYDPGEDIYRAAQYHMAMCVSIGLKHPEKLTNGHFPDCTFADLTESIREEEANELS